MIYICQWCGADKTSKLGICPKCHRFPQKTMVLKNKDDATPLFGNTTKRQERRHKPKWMKG